MNSRRPLRRDGPDFSGILIAFLIAMITNYVVLGHFRSSMRIFVTTAVTSGFLMAPSYAQADADLPEEDTIVLVDDVYDNPNLRFTDETKFVLSEKDAIENILNELHKMRHRKKSKLASKSQSKKLSEKIADKSEKKQSRKIASEKSQPLKGRLLQAKELMGKEYRSYFKVAKLVKKPDRHIHAYVKEAFADFDKKTRTKAKATSTAILSESKKYGFDPFFLLAVIENESNFDLKVRGDAGEIGLMQLLPDTAKWICEMNNWKWKGEKTLRDPVQNVKIGAAYLNLLREKFESESQLYISAYNMGPTNVYRALSRKVTPRDYHSKVLEFYISYYKQIKKEFDAGDAT